jgi:peptidyl-prolyl cis-trans isomerase SurA
MQPKLREYLTKLREESFVEVKPPAVDTGASGNEMKLAYSAYTPPAPKKKKKFQRARFRGKTRSTPVQTAQTATPPTAAPATAATETTAAAAPAAPTAPVAAATPAAVASAPPVTKPTQQASNNVQNVEKPGKREKIRFGQAPRESLPSSEVATAGAPDAGPSVTTPETRYVNPDGTVSGATDAPERKTRLSNRPPVHKVKTPKSTTDTTDQPTPDELATQKVQNAPLGLADPAAAKKAKQKGEKTRYSAKPKEEEDTTQPYLGKPESAPQAAPAASQPAAPGAPAAGPPQP